MWVLSQYTSSNLTFKYFSQNLSRRAKRIIEVPDSKRILKIYCKSSFEYLIVEDIVRNSVSELKTGSKRKIDLKEAKYLSNSSILLSTKEKTQK